MTYRKETIMSGWKGRSVIATIGDKSMSNRLSIPSTRCEISVVKMVDLTDLESIISPVTKQYELKYTSTKPDKFTVGDKWVIDVHSVTDESSANGKKKRNGYVIKGEFVVTDVIGNDIYLSSSGCVDFICSK